MKFNHTLVICLAFGLSLAPLAVWADDVPPADSKPLSEILRLVEENKLGLFSEVEFDDGLWELKVCEANGCQKLYIAPRSGDEVRRRSADSDDFPQMNARPLSTIIESVETLGLGSITEVEFDDGFWEVDIHKNGRRTKLFYDPMTGEVKRNS